MQLYAIQVRVFTLSNTPSLFNKYFLLLTLFNEEVFLRRPLLKKSTPPLVCYKRWSGINLKRFKNEQI